MSRPTAIALTHVAFEDPGSLAPVLGERGYAVRYVDACTAFTQSVDLLAADLVIVLGSPIGVYEIQTYPFLTSEIHCLGERLARSRPTLGVCLGAQLMGAALGSAVYPGQAGKEIGWSALLPGRDLDACPAFSELLRPEVRVLHWHGDTFDLPAGASHLASAGKPRFRRGVSARTFWRCSSTRKFSRQTWNAGTSGTAAS